MCYSLISHCSVNEPPSLLLYYPPFLFIPPAQPPNFRMQTPVLSPCYPNILIVITTQITSQFDLFPFLNYVPCFIRHPVPPNLAPPSSRRTSSALQNLFNIAPHLVYAFCSFYNISNVENLFRHSNMKSSFSFSSPQQVNIIPYCSWMNFLFTLKFEFKHWHYIHGTRNLRILKLITILLNKKHVACWVLCAQELLDSTITTEW